MANYRNFLSRGVVNNAYEALNPEMFLINIEGYRVSQNPIVNVPAPLIFKERDYADVNITQYSSFTSAFNGIYRYPCHILRPIKIGKSEILYVDDCCAFTEGKQPLYVKMFSGTTCLTQNIIMSTDVLFNDSSWINNMRLKIFKNCRDWGAKIIVDDDLLSSVIYKPAEANTADISEKVNEYLNTQSAIDYVTNRITGPHSY